MHVDSPAFWALNNWLDHVEKTLNPYKKYENGRKEKGKEGGEMKVFCVPMLMVLI